MNKKTSVKDPISWYTTGLPGSAKLRGKINSVESLQEMEELLQEM